MEWYIGLLRGVNVGGKNKVKMADLKKALAEAGFVEPGTLLQSGNVVFKHAHGKDLERQLEDLLEKHFGFRVDWIVRSREELESLLAKNPYPDQAEKDPAHLLVMFFRDELDPEQVAKVRAAVKGPETFELVGKHLFINFPEDIGHSKLFSTPGWKETFASGTGRNWNTLQKLVEMTQ